MKVGKAATNAARRSGFDGHLFPVEEVIIDRLSSQDLGTARVLLVFQVLEDESWSLLAQMSLGIGSTIALHRIPTA